MVGAHSTSSRPLPLTTIPSSKGVSSFSPLPQGVSERRPFYSVSWLEDPSGYVPKGVALPFKDYHVRSNSRQRVSKNPFPLYQLWGKEGVTHLLQGFYEETSLSCSVYRVVPVRLKFWFRVLYCSFFLFCVLMRVSQICTPSSQVFFLFVFYFGLLLFDRWSRVCGLSEPQTEVMDP